MSILTDFQQGQLPAAYLAAEPDVLKAKIRQAKKQLGERLLLLAHHYQKSEITAFADATGDSLQLAQIAADNQTAEYIVFCGVHFMAETADMLTHDDQKVILPDKSAGCSMADMADMHQVNRAWAALQTRYPGEVIPITYVNSSAAVKAFVGEQKGAIVTSGNAAKVLAWAFTQKRRVFFLPDQHLGRNTAYHMGISLEEMALWDPMCNELQEGGKESKIILWNGWCSVHQQFTTEQIASLRRNDPQIKIIVHPECPHEVVEAADEYGSTNKILQAVRDSDPATHWGIGTDHNLVERMQRQFPNRIEFINPIACACMTMNRIRLPHLAWSLDEILQGRVPNQITVDPDTTAKALCALQKMLALS